MCSTCFGVTESLQFSHVPAFTQLQCYGMLFSANVAGLVGLSGWRTLHCIHYIVLTVCSCALYSLHHPHCVFMSTVFTTSSSLCVCVHCIHLIILTVFMCTVFTTSSSLCVHVYCIHYIILTVCLCSLYSLHHPHCVFMCTVFTTSSSLCVCVHCIFTTSSSLCVCVHCIHYIILTVLTCSNGSKWHMEWLGKCGGNNADNFVQDHVQVPMTPRSAIAWFPVTPRSAIAWFP